MSIRDSQPSLYNRGRLREAPHPTTGIHHTPIGPRTDQALTHMAHVSLAHNNVRREQQQHAHPRAITPNRSSSTTADHRNPSNGLNQTRQSPRPFPSSVHSPSATTSRHVSPVGSSRTSPFRDVYKGSIHTNPSGGGGGSRHTSPYSTSSSIMNHDPQLYNQQGGTTAMTRLRDVSSTHEGRVMATVRRRAEQVISRYQRLHYIAEEDARSLEYCKNHCEAFMGNVESCLRTGVTSNEMMEQSAVRQAFEQWQSCNHLVTRAQLVITAHAEKSVLSGKRKSGGVLSSSSLSQNGGGNPHLGLNSTADDVSYVQRSLSPFQTTHSDAGVSGFSGGGGGGNTPRSQSPYGRTASNHSRTDTIASRSTAAPSTRNHQQGATSTMTRGDLQQGVAELRALQQLKNHDGDSAARTYELCRMVYGEERGHIEFVSWMSLLPTAAMNTVAECVLGVAGNSSNQQQDDHLHHHSSHLSVAH